MFEDKPEAQSPDESAMRQAELEALQMAVLENPSDPGFPRLAEFYASNGDAERALRIAEAGLAELPDHVEGRVARALALLHLGRTLNARSELEGLLRSHAEPVEGAPAPEPASDFSSGVEESEIEQAFEQAEARPEEMIDANRVAEAAIRMEELDGPDEDFAADESPVYTTETMAGLLEGQGDRAGAEHIRSSLAAAPAGARARSTEVVRDEFLAEVESIPEASLDFGIESAAELPPAAMWEPEVDAAQVVSEPSPPTPPGKADANRIRVIATLERWLENVRGGAA